MKNRPSRGRRSGFTLIEIIVTVTILSILAGAAIPVTAKVMTYQARKATRTELQALSIAAAEYFGDTWTLPGDLADLLVDPGISGWAGPYLPGVVTDHITGLTGYQVDAWSRPYTIAAVGDRLTITSKGEDGQAGTGADIDIVMDVTNVRRGETLARLGVINQAVLSYNANASTAADMLGGTWTDALAALVAESYLPDTDIYLVDAWGVTFVEDPAGVNPITRVKSASVGAAAQAN